MKISIVLQYSSTSGSVTNHLSNITSVNTVPVDGSQIHQIQTAMPLTNPSLTQNVDNIAMTERYSMPELEIINNEVIYSPEGLLNNLSIHTEIENNPFAEQIELLKRFDSGEEHSPISQLGPDEEYIIEQIEGNIGTVGSTEILSPDREPFSQRFYSDIIEIIVNGAGASLQTTIIGSVALICVVGGAHYILRKIKKKASSLQENDAAIGNSGAVPHATNITVHPKFGGIIMYAGAAFQLFLYLSKLG